MRLPITSAFLFTTLAAGAAFAQSWPANDPGYAPPPGPPMTASGESFGDRGQLVFTSDFDLDFRKATTEFRGAESDQTSLTLSPTVDFFLAKNLSLGGTVILDRRTFGDDSETTFLIGPQVGYNLSLGSALSIWPRFGLLWARGSQTVMDNEETGSGFSLTAFVPVLFHPAPHFFLGIGPRFSRDLTSKWEGDDGPNTTVIGLDFVIGGWL